MTPDPDLHEIEREAEEARTRLANSLGRLTGPEAADAAKSEVMKYVQTAKDEITDYAAKKKDEVSDYAVKTKDELIEQVRSTAEHKAYDFAEDLKARAQANPVAVALIGAGIAWRLYKHPPITTALVGAGVAMLMTGGRGKSTGYRAHSPYDEDQPSSYVPGGVAGQGYPSQDPGIGQRVSSATARAGEVAHDLGTRAQELASEATDRLRQAGDRAAIGLSETAERAEAGLSQASASAATMAHRVGRTTGARAQDWAGQAERVVDRARGNPLVIGGLGVLGGIAVLRAIQSTDAGSRAFADGRRAFTTGSRRGTAAASDLARRAASLTSDAVSATRDTLGSAASAGLAAAGDVSSTLSDMGSRVVGRTGGTARAAGSTGRSSGPGGHTGRRGHSVRREHRSAGPSPAGEWFSTEVLGLAERYPLLLGAIGLTMGAAVGGSLRLTPTERGLLGPLGQEAKRQAMAAAEEGYAGLVHSAEQTAEALKTRLASTDQPADLSSDFETVLGGGKPPVDEASPATGIGPR